MFCFYARCRSSCLSCHGWVLFTVDVELLVWYVTGAHLKHIFSKQMFDIRWAVHVHQMKKNELQYRSWHSARHRVNCWWAGPVVMWHCLHSSLKVESAMWKQQRWISQHARRDLCGTVQKLCRWRVTWTGRVRVTSHCVSLWHTHQLHVQPCLCPTASCKCHYRVPLLWVSLSTVHWYSAHN